MMPDDVVDHAHYGLFRILPFWGFLQPMVEITINQHRSGRKSLANVSVFYSVKPRWWCVYVAKEPK